MAGQSEKSRPHEQHAERIRWVRSHPQRLAANERVWEASKQIAVSSDIGERAAARARYLAAIEALRKVEEELARQYEAEMV